jgi:hypothetical protein
MGTRNQIHQASDAIHNGQKNEARQILEELVASEPENAQAWATLFSVLDTPADRYHALHQAVELDPKNERLHEKMKKYRASGEYRAYKAGLSAAAAQEKEGERQAVKKGERKKGLMDFLRGVFTPRPSKAR